MKNSISVLGCGWLGEPLAYSLVQKGYKVKGSSRSEQKLSKLTQNGVEAHFVDCTLDLDYSSFFDSDILICCLTNKNVAVAKHLISIIDSSSIKNVLFISSTSVYKSEDKEVTEESPLVESPLVEIEQLFNSSHHFDTTIIRFAGLVGGERHPGRFFAKGNPLKSPQASVNLIHLEDCIQLIESIIVQQKWSQIYNACSSIHPPKGEFYTKVAQKGGYASPVIVETITAKDKVVSNKKMLQDLSIQLIYPDLLALYS